jgi:CheY-like chemotaxis protein
MIKKVRKILLVDDNPVAQKMTQKAFQNAGYQVFLAWNEEECLRQAKEISPDAILMDVIFPNGDGKDFVKRLKQDPDTRKIPIIFATNTVNIHDDKGNLTIKIEDTFYRAFAKPLHYPKLLSTVRKEINRLQNPSK